MAWKEAYVLESVCLLIPFVAHPNVQGKKESVEAKFHASFEGKKEQCGRRDKESLSKEENAFSRAVHNQTVLRELEPKGKKAQAVPKGKQAKFASKKANHAKRVSVFLVSFLHIF